MKEAMVNFEKTVNELMENCKAAMGSLVFETDMDDRALNVLKLSFKLVDASMEVMKAQSEMMIEMNNKLDTLIEK